MEYTIVHKPKELRFVTVVDGITAYVEYRHHSHNAITITHTIVPKPIEGRGVAAALVKAALEFAHANNLTVHSLCSYATAYMKRHNEQ